MSSGLRVEWLEDDLFGKSQIYSNDNQEKLATDLYYSREYPIKPVYVLVTRFDAASQPTTIDEITRWSDNKFRNQYGLAEWEYASLLKVHLIGFKFVMEEEIVVNAT